MRSKYTDMELFDNHRKLFRTATLFFVGLTLLVAIIPAMKVQRNNAPPPGAVPLSEDARKGKAVFIAEGCVACHTQQVRNVDMDKVWGERPGIAADYADIHRTDFWRNTATLMGTERTGPDLTNVGVRQPSLDWNLSHLFNPRIVVKESVMPAYPWLFTFKKEPGEKNKVVNVPESYTQGKEGKYVARPEALYLVAYLQSLKQTKLPDGSATPEFLYKRKGKPAAGDSAANASPDGAQLYMTHCQACHQENGEGLKGAFPALKGSKIVLDENPEIMAEIIMNGYNGRASEGFGPMPAVGTNAGLSAEEVAAIMNHEKTSWGNNAKPVTSEEIQKIIDIIKFKSP